MSAATRREQLAALALGILERDGLDKFSIGELARAAGIKAPSLYKHFAGKADIELDLVIMGMTWQAEAYREAIASLGQEPSRRSQVQGFARAYRAFGVAHPQLYRLINDRPLPVNLPPEVFAATHVDYSKLVPDPLEARSLWAWAHGLTSLEISGRFGPDEDIDGLWQVLIDTLAPAQ